MITDPLTRPPRPAFPRPTIYLSNWASRRTAGRHGPGRKWTIMAMPNPDRGELGEGSVQLFVPSGPALPLLQELVRQRREYGEVDPETVAQYRGLLEGMWARLGDPTDPLNAMRPGRLFATGAPNVAGAWVEDGDTLNCACSAAASAAGGCHRAWAAPFLQRVGWRIILDGKELANP